ncbi:NmrA family NAD(P)-binding protein [Streptomyces griseoloalbus]|uniref:NmrA family NAD(P)-binding protein n=1 Tax=Streptomyces griseoloalbus TaxID=67303 RepID=UPI003F540550
MRRLLEPERVRHQALATQGSSDGHVAGSDLGDPESLRAAFSDAHGVFSVQPTSGQAGAGVTDEDEVRFGTTVAEIADRRGVAHLVHSSTVAAGPTPTGVGHLDTKSLIEAHVRNLDIASTIIRPATFMEILLLPGMGLDRGHVSFLMSSDQVHLVDRGTRYRPDRCRGLRLTRSVRRTHHGDRR